MEKLITTLKSCRITLVALLLAAPAAAQQETFGWTVPGVVKASGLRGTSYVSDLVMTNAGAGTATVILEFAPRLDSLQETYSVRSGQSLTFRDVVSSVFGVGQAVGALLVTADQPMVLRARTYNNASSGTFGVALPVVEDARLLEAGETADSLWVDVNAAPDRGYRTNVTVVFPDADGGAAKVTLYDALGRPAGQKDFALDAPGLQQFGAGDFATGPLPVGRAQVRVKRGHAAGYCVVVDNVTGDGSLYPFEDVPAGAQDVVVNGVTRANGQLGAFWRTDARLYNPTDQDAAVTVAFHAAGDASPSPETRSLTVPAGQILDVPDVLRALLGLPVGSSGALRLRSAGPVALLCRTSNLDPTGARPGTFGGQQRSVPLLSYLTSADAGAIVTGVKQGTAYRTNVGFSAGPDGASYSLTLKQPSGGTLATATGSLGPFGWAQPNVGSLFPGASIPDGSQVVVKVTAGSLDLYDSAIDNGSGDPVVSPTMPVPVTIPSSATIGAAGGSIRSDDGRLTVKIPAGALSVAASVSLQAVPSTEANAVGSGYSLTYGGASFTKAPLAVLRYTARELVGSGPEHLLLAYQSAGALRGLRGSTCDTSTRTLWTPLVGPAFGASSALSRNSRETLRNETVYAFLPITDFKISPAKAGVLGGGIVNLKVTGSTRREDGTLVPRDFSHDTTWTLVWGEGELLAVGGDATYVAPQEVDCVESPSIKFEHRNPEGTRSFVSFPVITLLPRQWELTAVAAVEANLCNISDDSPRFELTTDKIKIVMTLTEDPAGNGFQFMQTSVGAIVTEGTLKTVSWCQSKDCQDSWVDKPSTKMTFYGGTERSGGWENERGSFYLRNWGLILGGLYKWRRSCTGLGDTDSQAPLPTLAFVDDPWHLKLQFDPPDPELSCGTSKLIDWKRWRALIKSPIARKDIYNGTAYLMSLHPR